MLSFYFLLCKNTQLSLESIVCYTSLKSILSLIQKRSFPHLSLLVDICYIRLQQINNYKHANKTFLYRPAMRVLKLYYETFDIKNLHIIYFQRVSYTPLAHKLISRLHFFLLHFAQFYSIINYYNPSTFSPFLFV